jgi:hypothetical protein
MSRPKLSYYQSNYRSPNHIGEVNLPSPYTLTVYQTTIFENIKINVNDATTNVVQI